MNKRLKQVGTVALVVTLLAPGLLTESKKTEAQTAHGAVVFTNSNYYVNSAYNRSNAGTYAINKAEYVNRNTNYPDYGSNPDNGDCTNFVSQVLHDGGGLPFQGTNGYNRNTIDWYYYGPNVTPANGSNGNYRSSSWTGAHQFRGFWGGIDGSDGNHAYQLQRYTMDEAITYFSEIYSDLWVGDIVQFADASYHTVHSVAVNYYDAGHLYVAQHSTSANATDKGYWGSGKNLKDMITQRKNQGTSTYVYTLKVKADN
jgi:hypothetical protein